MQPSSKVLCGVRTKQNPFGRRLVELAVLQTRPRHGSHAKVQVLRYRTSPSVDIFDAADGSHDVERDL